MEVHERQHANSVLTNSEDDIEVVIVHEECNAYAKSAVLPALLCLAIALNSDLDFTTRVGSLISGLIVTSAAVVARLGTRVTDRETLLKRAHAVGIYGAVIRLVVHYVWIVSGSDSVFFRCLTLFLLPLSSARQSHSVVSFQASMLVQFLLTCFRFRNDLEEGLPWIGASTISIAILLDVAAQKEAGRSARVLLHAMQKRTEKLAQSTVESLLAGFCDAHVVLDKNLQLLEPSPNLGALIGRQAVQGKQFMEFIDLSDLAELEQHVNAFAAGQDVRGENGTEGQAPSLQMQSVRVHLIDSLTVAIPVHLFFAFLPAAGAAVFMVGICEVWQPKKIAKKDSSRFGRKTSYDVSNGTIVPQAPMFPADFKKELPAFDPLQELGSSAVRQRRPDSPRPHLSTGFGLKKA